MLPPRRHQLQIRPHLSPTHPLVQPSTHRPAPPTNTCTPYHSKLAVLPRLNVILVLFLAHSTDLDYPRPLRSPHLNLILRSFLHSPLALQPSVQQGHQVLSVSLFHRPSSRSKRLQPMVTTDILLDCSLALLNDVLLTALLTDVHCDKLALHFPLPWWRPGVKRRSNIKNRQRLKAQISSCLSSSPTSSSPTRLINPIRHRDCQSHPSPLFPSNNPICSSPSPSSTVHLDAPHSY